ncbi:MAG: CBS domain-containing protein [Clostridia bacterium]|jgi:CBS domain-containing protein|nr:CBS domain-containing protein [Spirochaetia bacterium]
MVEKVKDILASKGTEVVSVTPETGIMKALEVMAEHNIGAILVLDASGEVAGIFSERDFARKIILKANSCDTTIVKEVMTKKIVYADPSDSIENCMDLMTAHHFRHLPVKENGKLVGVISIGDVVKALIERQGRIISQQAFEIGQNERKSSGAI